jgi:hypothetical protein
MNTSANTVPQLCRKITVKAIQNLGTDQPIFDPSRIIRSFYLHHHVQNGSEITRLSPDDITRPMRIREFDNNPIQFLDLLRCINNQMANYRYSINRKYNNNTDKVLTTASQKIIIILISLSGNISHCEISITINLLGSPSFTHF